MNRRRRLRTRIFAAMLAVALGVLVLTVAVAAALARRSEVRTARDDVQARASVIAPEFDSLLATLPASRSAAAATAAGRRQLQRIRQLVATTLEAANGAVVGVSSDGTVNEVLSTYLGTDPALVTLPKGLQGSELDTTKLLAGHAQDGQVGDTVFRAVPLQQRGAVTPVVVLSEAVNTRPFGGNTGAVLVAAGLAMLGAALASAYLARRMTKPLAAMEATAHAIAGGDLGARVDTEHVGSDELGTLAEAINGMASDLDAARGHERAFLLSVSHDLRTPLTSIRGYAEAIADGTVQGADARVRAAGVIASESRRLERLVADLLDLARLDAHEFSLHPSAIDVRATVAQAVDAFRPAATDLGIALGLLGGDPAPAVADPQRVAQIVANLVENALKYAVHAVWVGVEVHDATVTLWVDDDGPGIPPDERGRVFERLYTSRTTPGRTVGTGLGLAIVRELALAMGGAVRVEDLESGTRFVVTFPTSPAPVPAAAPARP